MLSCPFGTPPRGKPSHFVQPARDARFSSWTSEKENQYFKFNLNGGWCCRETTSFGWKIRGEKRRGRCLLERKPLTVTGECARDDCRGDKYLMLPFRIICSTTTSGWQDLDKLKSTTDPAPDERSTWTEYYFDGSLTFSSSSGWPNNN